MCVATALVAIGAEASTAAAISTALAVASAAASYTQKQNEADNVRATAAYNARVKENEAVQVRNKGVTEENAVREKTARLNATQRAQLGASGLDINSGSALDIQTDASIQGNVDAMRIKTNFLDTAEAKSQDARNTIVQGNAKASGIQAGATASLLGSAAKIAGGVADNWYTADSAAYTDEAAAAGEWGTF